MPKPTIQSNPITHTIDLKNKVLGRVATDVANLLRGKNKPNFDYNKLMGDKVIVFNAKSIYLSGQKMEQKKYYRHSGYLGNLKTINVKDQLANKPELVFTHAVKGMLPKNRLRKEWLKNLTIYAGEINE